MLTHECEAVVLAALDYGETDRIVTLFTREHGKVRAIARHGKKSVKRFSGALEVFARLRLHLVLKEGLSSLRSTDIITVFPHIRNDLLKISYAGYACEVVDRLLPEAMCNTRLFRLLVTYLDQLESAPSSVDDRRFFEVNLLNILGYRLSLEQCCRCGADICDSSGALQYSSAGELVCSDCGSGGHQLSSASRSLLKNALATGRFGVVRFPEASLREAGVVLDAAIASHLNRPLHSLQFLQHVLGVQPQ
ncbi:MAG: DNA repair protein RecO [Deltaproteobacteria bacterium]|nr:DNA repair protein RecO [Deltaproteobacteria bacterium]TLN00663.1 MAG: DNA repair protein RecO [bacterium]